MVGLENSQYVAEYELLVLDILLENPLFLQVESTFDLCKSNVKNEFTRGQYCGKS